MSKDKDINPFESLIQLKSDLSKNLALIPEKVRDVLSHVGSEFKERVLSKREQARIGTAIMYARMKIEKNIKEGKEIRQDGFFESKGEGMSDADEIYEGTLLAAQRDHEEKKLKYYGNLIGNLGFAKEFDKSQANYFIKISEGLTYRQICLLKIIVESMRKNIVLRDKNYRDRQLNYINDRYLIIILQEIFSLYNLHLINGSGTVYAGIKHIVPSKLQIHSAGIYLHDLMELWDVDSSDIDPIVKELSQ